MQKGINGDARGHRFSFAQTGFGVAFRAELDAGIGSVYAATPVASIIAVATTIASTIVMPFESPASLSSPPHHNVKVGPIALAGAQRRMHITSFVAKSNGKKHESHQAKRD